MSDFNRERVIHKKSKDWTYRTDCVKCRSGSLSPWKFKWEVSTLIFQCGDSKLGVDMLGFENFDVERAQEVMDTLRDILDEAGIAWADESTKLTEFDSIPFIILRTHITYQGKFYSVIIGTGTYGGENYKLELMSNAVNNGEPIGGLTVTEVIGILKNGYNTEV